jgi:hypothetical protein
MTPDNAGLMPRGPPIPLTLRIKTLTERLDAQATDLDRYTMLHSILETDATLYFGTILSDVRKFLPLVYTPTVGEACVNFSKIHTHQPKGIYLSKCVCTSERERLLTCSVSTPRERSERKKTTSGSGAPTPPAPCASAKKS